MANEQHRRLLVPLLVAFVVLDVTALALLGPVSPADTAAHVERLYTERAGLVLVSRFVHCLGLIVAFWLLGLLVARLRERGTDETVVRVAYGGFVALVPIEVVRNVMISALALRYDDMAAAALPLHVIAVLLGPSIAFPIAAALAGLAWSIRSRPLGALAGVWVLSGIRIVTDVTLIWYGGLVAFVALLLALAVLSVSLARPDATPVP